MCRAVPPSNKTIAICDTQPIYAEGLRSLLAGSAEFDTVKTLDSLQAAAEFVKAEVPDLLIIDRGFGITAVLNFMRELQLKKTPTAITVWGNSITVKEAAGLVRAGACGIARKTTDLPTLLAGLRVVASGQVWMESSILPNISAKPWPRSSDLSPRQNQVLELLGQGLKNPEIALQLGIQLGTVKIHIKRLFEKANVRSRYYFRV